MATGLELRLHGIQSSNLVTAQTLNLNVGAGVVFAAVKDPRAAGDQQHDAKGDDAVVHVDRVDGQAGREDKENRREDGPEDADLCCQ